MTRHQNRSRIARLFARLTGRPASRSELTDSERRAYAMLWSS